MNLPLFLKLFLINSFSRWRRCTLPPSLPRQPGDPEQLVALDLGDYIGSVGPLV